MNKYTPIFDRVLIKEEPVTETMKGNIIIPQSVLESEPITFGKVIGKGERTEVVNVDDRVMYPRGAGIEILIKEESFRLMQEREILMID